MSAFWNPLHISLPKESSVPNLQFGFQHSLSELPDQTPNTGILYQTKLIPKTGILNQTKLQTQVFYTRPN